MWRHARAALTYQSWVVRYRRNRFALHGATKWTRTCLTAIKILPLASILVFAVVQSHNPRVLSTAEIRSEYLAIAVVDARKAAFFVAGVKIGPLGGKTGGCSSGLVTPTRGTTVAYGRVGDGPLEITLKPSVSETGTTPDLLPVGSFEPGDGKPPVPLRGQTLLMTDESCRPPKSQRLPFWGHARVGQEFHPEVGNSAAAPSFLLGGKLEVAAHAFWTGTLYGVTKVALPVGGRLQTYGPGQLPELAIWWGTATLDPEHVALEVMAATQAPRLALYYPNQTDADVIEVSKLAQLTTDPTIIRLGFLVTIGLFLLSSLASLAGLWHEHEKDRLKQDAPPPSP